MNHLSTSIVQQYLTTNFIPHLDKAIKNKIQERMIVANVPRVIAKNIVDDFLTRTLNNNSHNPQISVQHIPEVFENTKVPDNIKIPTKKQQSHLTSPPKISNSTEQNEKTPSNSNSRVTTQCSNLIKLASPQEEESEEVGKMRKIKEMMRKYEQTKEKNRIINQRNQRISGLQKKATISHCQYHHTYGYQAEILEVNPLHLEKYQESKYEPSLLQKLKSNLDAQLQNQLLSSKIKQIQKSKQKQKIERIPACKIGAIQQQHEDLSSKGNKKHQVGKKDIVQSHLRPLWKFEESDIKSLSNNIEKQLEEGVRMITHQHRIVQDNYPNKHLKIQEETTVKEKNKKHKQNTNSSQSVIYALEKQIKNYSALDQYSKIRAESSIVDHQRFRSLQLSQALQAKYEAFSQFENKRQIDHSRAIDSKILGIHLPQIRCKRKQNFSKKRTATEQKIIKGLDNIQVKVNTPQKKQSVHFSHRPRHLSALSLNRQTESSLEEMEQSREHSKESEARSKKELVKDYFQNYKAQFRQRIKGIQQVINLYG